MSDTVLVQQQQGPAGASGAGVSGSGVVSVVNGGLVSPAISGTIGQLLAMATATAVAFVSLSGDVVSSGVTPGVTTVSGITGVAGTGAIHCATLQYDAGAGNAAISQAATSGASGASLTIQAQGSTAATGTGGNLVLAGGTATGATSGTPGNVVVTLNPRSGTGGRPNFQVGGDGQAAWLSTQTAVGFGVGAVAVYFGVGIPATPSGTNYLLLYEPSSNNLHFNNAQSTDTVFEIAGIELMRLSRIAASNFLELGVGGLTWTAIASAPTLSQLSTGGSPGLNMTIQAQGSTSATGVGGNLILSGGPAAGATSGTPGNVIVQMAAPTGTGTVAQFQTNISGHISFLADNQGVMLGRTDASQRGMRVAPLVGQETSYVGMWTGANATSPTGSNYDLALGGTAGNVFWQTLGINFGNFNQIAMTLTNGTTAQLSWAAGVTSTQLTQTVSAGTGATAGLAFTIQAQAGQQQTGATANNDGGPLQLKGGAAGTGGSGAAGVDGRVIIAMPFDAGELEFTPVNGANSLTNAQSDANVLDLLAGATAAFTITLARRVANTTLLFVRNNTSQTATIAYLTGGTVTVATATSALIASNGTNLVKIMVGT